MTGTRIRGPKRKKGLPRIMPALRGQGLGTPRSGDVGAAKGRVEISDKLHT